MNESKETESATLLNEPKKELKKKKSKNEMDTTRINNNFSPTDFKLDEHDIEEVSNFVALKMFFIFFYYKVCNFKDIN